LRPTERLYFHDSLLLDFHARVVAHATWDGRPSVVLDRTAFYPESGGQQADRGTLGGIEIVDVQVDDAGLVHHVLDGALPQVGAEQGGTIDRDRRRLHMALHTGQHMLSRALADLAQAGTVSSRLGETLCTIDLSRDKIEERDLARAEELTNAVIDADAPIRAFFPTAEELPTLPLRREPKVDENIRVIEIGDFDLSPCGGTHCTRTAQVGLVRITGIERYKGKLRVSFAAGRRARDEVYRHDQILRGLGRDFTCGAAEVPAAIQKLRRELGETRETLGQARATLADARAEELLAAARLGQDPRIVAEFSGVDVDFLRAIAKRITAEAGMVALLAARSAEGLHVLCARGAGSRFDCGHFLKQATTAHGGRGGGSPDRAEGRLPAGTDWLAMQATLET
jgi:alanyl-tRNA synthetase